MKLVFFYVLSGMVLASAFPSIQNFKSYLELDPAGAYKQGFETEKKINREETGEPREIKNEEDKPKHVIVARGSYSYTAEDGTPITVTYYADETGFHAEGAHIPVAPKK